MILHTKINFTDTLFILFIIIYLFLGLYLILNIPYGTLYGGPDESIHLSLAEYISKHHHWAYWNDPELIRHPVGVSYTTGSSIIYWLHGLSFELFQHHRIGAYLMLVIYLSTASLIYLRNKVAGLFILATLLPQTLFITSYVNSDSGTLITALLFGLAAANFTHSPENKYSFILLFMAAGFTVTARQSLWPISLATLLMVVFFFRSVILQFPKHTLLIAFFIALLPSSWWFYTSYTYNDGDFLGVFTTSKSILQFGRPDFSPEILARPWDEIILKDFIISIWKSIYGMWGWMYVSLSLKIYLVATIVLLTMYITTLKHIALKTLFISVIILLINFLFMLIYSTSYDYQAQGRYMFPSMYVIIGLTAGTLLFKQIKSRITTIIAIIAIIMNIFITLHIISNHYYTRIQTQAPAPNNIQPINLGQITIDQLSYSDDRKHLILNGWAVDISNRSLFEEIIIQVNNSYFKANYLQHREDVASHFNNEQYKKSGFSLIIPLEMIQKTHNINNITVFAKSIDNTYIKLLYSINKGS